MHKIYPVLILAILLLPIKANGKECALYYDGLNPLTQTAPLIESIDLVRKGGSERERRSQRQDQIEKINSLGIELYIDKALKGTEKNNIVIGGREFNLIDLALIKGAEKKTIHQLFQIGFYLSPHSIPLLINTYESKEFIDIIKEMTLSGLDNLLIDHNGNEYSIVNFLLLNKDFYTIKYMVEEYDFDVTSNMILGDMVDLGSLNLEERMKASSVVHLKNYMEIYKDRKKKSRKYLYAKMDFNNEFRYYRLKHNCSNFSSADYSNVKYAVKASIIKELIKELDIDINSSQPQEIIKLVRNPIIEEYLINEVLKHKREEKAVRKAKFISEFHTLSKNEIRKLLQDDSFFYINKDSITLNEYLFLKSNLSWEKGRIEMRINRLASYLINSGLEDLDHDTINKLYAISSMIEDGKNLPYYLLKYARNSESLFFIQKNFPPPQANYGVNPIEMLRIKSELDIRLKEPVQYISKSLQNRYKDRL